MPATRLWTTGKVEICSTFLFAMHRRWIAGTSAKNRRQFAVIWKPGLLMKLPNNSSKLMNNSWRKYKGKHNRAVPLIVIKTRYYFPQSFPTKKTLIFRLSSRISLLRGLVLKSFKKGAVRALSKTPNTRSSLTHHVFNPIKQYCSFFKYHLKRFCSMF